MINGVDYDVETIALLGGHPALDFVNTIENRVGPTPDDTLRTTDDLRRWGRRLGLLSTVQPDWDLEPGDVELGAARALRTTLLALFDAVVSARPAGERHRAALAAAVSRAHAHGMLVADDGVLRWSWDDIALATVHDSIASRALELLAGPHVHRVHRCDGPDCGWFFLDVSKNGTRRWCSMRGCGNRVKSRQRRERH